LKKGGNPSCEGGVGKRSNVERIVPRKSTHESENREKDLRMRRKARSKKKGLLGKKIQMGPLEIWKKRTCTRTEGGFLQIKKIIPTKILKGGGAGTQKKEKEVKKRGASGEERRGEGLRWRRREKTEDEKRERIRKPKKAILSEKEGA